jgi:DNA-binding MarR family transcriptional regulator
MFMGKSSEIITNIRKIMRAIDLHSNQLVQKYNMTGPQLVLCNTLIENGKLTVSELAKKIHLSKATVVSILNRLSVKGFITRQKDNIDKRKVFVIPTEQLQKVFIENPPNLLQEQFVEQFENLKEWEQSLILSSFERVAEMMHATKIDASPIFHSQN